ncbi:MAG TPA: VOC family protein [Nocardioidaceae bacterium]|jgi:catechol 2,3-dioxygenase-like lactoylglutathione lyase family enzyme
MSSTETGSGTSAPTADPKAGEWRLEVIGLPVADVDRAKDFYVNTLGWRLDADFNVNENFWVVQVTPPGSLCSIHFGKGITTAAPGSIDHMYLVVTDLEAARAELVDRGVEVSEIFHLLPGEDPKPGVDPAHGTYQSYATFADPDGNLWSLQEITTRLPGR